MTVILGVSGEVGSFSEEAGLLYAKNAGIQPTLAYLVDMEGVLSAVEAGIADLGIFPVVNKRGGLVKMAFEAMGRHFFTPIDELWLDVHQCLLAQSATQQKDIQKIVSHSQALLQCKGFLQKEFPDVELVEWQDTAQAAKDLAEGKLDVFTAVLAPANSARVYGLKIIAEDVQDERPNLTAFVVVER
jgi:prephenate dehydratase